MRGPYPLNKKNIDDNVESDKRGVYKLYKSNPDRDRPVRYVGRSETKNLRRRLLNWKDDYRFFEFKYCSSKKETFKSEAALYHLHKNKLDNQKHPCQPYNGLRCPICNMYG